VKAGVLATLLVLGSLGLLASANAASPSFSCTGNLSPTEKTICSDDSLAALDVALTAAYKKALAALPEDSANSLDETRVGLTVTQKAWIAYRNTCGVNKVCIAKAYQVRTGELTAGPNTPDVPCNDTVGAAAAAFFVKHCTQVATATHPPCNAANTCELIVSHNANRCAFLGDQAPKFCAAYLKP
jgi:uncharacterized protein YecT (DUF1311 family)